MGIGEIIILTMGIGEIIILRMGIGEIIILTMGIGEIIILATLTLSSANALNLVKAKILSFSKGLTIFLTVLR